MDINEVYKLMGNFENSTMTELNLEMEGVKLSMKKGATFSERPVHTVVDSYEAIVKNDVVEKKEVLKEAEVKSAAVGEGIEIKAPLVGTFYRAASPEEKPFVILGQQVKKGDVVGIVEAMKLMNEIVAPEDGVVESILVEDGTMVEYNEVLIRLSK